MWLNNLRISEKKSLSSVEFLVLANTVSASYIEAQYILKSINDQINHWNTTPGSIYPVLHRLTNCGLLEQNKLNKMQFKISIKGASFLISTIRVFQDNYESTASYFTSILRGFINLDPLQSIDMLEKFQGKASLFMGKMEDLKIEATEATKREKWKEIDIKF